MFSSFLSSFFVLFYFASFFNYPNPGLPPPHTEKVHCVYIFLVSINWTISTESGEKFWKKLMHKECQHNFLIYSDIHNCSTDLGTWFSLIPCTFFVGEYTWKDVRVRSSKNQRRW